MFTQEDAEKIRSGFKNIESGSAHHFSEIETRYLNHYGINFSQPLKHDSDKNISKTALAKVHSFGYFDTSSFRIACHIYYPNTDQILGTVFLLHGYYDHTGIYGKPIKYFLEKGYVVFIVDLPGHGLSTGDSAVIESFGQYHEVFLQSLKQADNAELPKPWSLLAQSTGAAIVMNYLVSTPHSNQQDFKRVVLLAPLIRPKNWLLGRIQLWFVSPFVQKVKRNFTENSSDAEFMHFITHSDPLQARFLSAQWVTAFERWLKEFENSAPVTVPLKVIQGNKDRTVDWNYNLKIIARIFPNSSKQIIANAQHQLVNESEEIRDEIKSVLDSLF